MEIKRNSGIWDVTLCNEAIEVVFTVNTLLLQQVKIDKIANDLNLEQGSNDSYLQTLEWFLSALAQWMIETNTYDLPEYCWQNGIVISSTNMEMIKSTPTIACIECIDAFLNVSQHIAAVITTIQHRSNLKCFIENKDDLILEVDLQQSEVKILLYSLIMNQHTTVENWLKENHGIPDLKTSEGHKIFVEKIKSQLDQNDSYHRGETEKYIREMLDNTSYRLSENSLNLMKLAVTF